MMKTHTTSYVHINTNIQHIHNLITSSPSIKACCVKRKKTRHI